MTDFYSAQQLDAMNADQLDELAHRVARRQAKLAPPKDPAMMTDREVAVWTAAMIAEADRKKREASNG